LKKLILLGVIMLLAAPATAALAVPMCDGPDFGKQRSDGSFVYDEAGEAARAEMMLRSHGIDAHLTRFWNGCIQTFVSENGQDVMKFYDPDTYREVPVN
jgi:hypothetical protein